MNAAFQRLGLLVALAAALTGCGGSDTSGGTLPSEVVGPIISIEQDAGAIVAFRVDKDGKSLLIKIDRDRDYGFDLAHLREHEQTAEPVRVLTQQRDDGPYALQIDDG